MVGGIKASSTGMKSMSADMFLDLPTMSAPSGEERRTDASAQVERAGWCCRRPDSGTHTCWGRATVSTAPLTAEVSIPQKTETPRALSASCVRYHCEAESGGRQCKEQPK